MLIEYIYLLLQYEGCDFKKASEHEVKSVRQASLHPVLPEHMSAVHKIFDNPLVTTPKRDESICSTVYINSNISLRSINLNEFLDNFVEHIIISIQDKDYTYSAKWKKNMIDLFLMKDHTLFKGSFECFLMQLQNSKVTEIYEKLKKELSLAGSLQLSASSIHWQKVADEIQFKNIRIKLVVLKPVDRNCFPSLFIKRVNSCSVMFVQELSMYPTLPEMAIDCSVELVPLTDDWHIAVEKSLWTGGFKSLIEICFCDEEVLNYIRPPNNEIEVLVIIESCKHDTTDNSYILSTNKSLLQEEMQPEPLAESILNKEEMEKFKENKNRKDKVDFLCRIIERDKTFDRFLEIIRMNFEYLHDRLQKSRMAFIKRHFILRNIIRNFYDLCVGNRLHLEDFRQIFIDREVFANETFNEIVINCSGKNEKEMQELLVRIILTGPKAVFTFVDALYEKCEDDLADLLLGRPQLNAELGINYNINSLSETKQGDVLLHASFKANCN